MRRISILNFKGGQGKSTLTDNIGHALARQNLRVLIIDCDRQLKASSSSILPEIKEPTLFEVLKGQAALIDAIQQARDNLFVVPGHRNLKEAANHIVVSGMRAYNILKNATKNLQGFDFILFDHSPSHNAITDVALLASDEILIPVELEPFAIEGMLDMFETIGETLRDLDHEVKIKGIVPFKLDERYSMSEIYLASLKKRFGELVIQPIRTDASVKRAQSLKQTVFEYDPHSKAAQDFMALAKLLIPEGVNV